MEKISKDALIVHIECEISNAEWDNREHNDLLATLQWVREWRITHFWGYEIWEENDEVAEEEA